MKSMVFLVDESSKQLSALKNVLSERDEFELVGMTTDGEQSVEELKGKHVDLLILDMILPKRDGFYVLEEIRRQRLDVKHIICMTSYLNEMIMTRMNEYDVDYIMMKPYSLADLAEKARYIASYEPDLSRRTRFQDSLEKNHDQRLEHEVSELLHELGVPANLKGYQYLRSAIIKTYENMDLMGKVTKALYPCIAQEFETTPSRVERGIRHAIEVAWNRGNVQVIHQIFGYTVSVERSKPTNSEFIAMISDKLHMQDQMA